MSGTRAERIRTSIASAIDTVMRSGERRRGLRCDPVELPAGDERQVRAEKRRERDVEHPEWLRACCLGPSGLVKRRHDAAYIRIGTDGAVDVRARGGVIVIELGSVVDLSVAV